MKIIFPTDEHIPYDDKYACELAMKIARDFDPDIRIAGSDGIDFYAVSSYDKDPARLKFFGLQQEINQWKERQKEWRDATPRAEVHYLVGNHEDRMRRYLWRHPEIFGLEVLNLDKLLNLEGLGIKYDEKNLNYVTSELKFGPLTIKHGTFARKYSAYSVKAEMEANAFSSHMMIGHVHRGALYVYRGADRLIYGAECFCLCDLNPGYAFQPNWHQGIVLATIRNEWDVTFEMIPFLGKEKNVRAYWRDKEYRL